MRSWLRLDPLPPGVWVPRRSVWLNRCQGWKTVFEGVSSKLWAGVGWWVGGWVFRFVGRMTPWGGGSCAGELSPKNSGAWVGGVGKKFPLGRLTSESVDEILNWVPG